MFKIIRYSVLAILILVIAFGMMVTAAADGEATAVTPTARHPKRNHRH